MQTIGLLGGMSWESTELYYRLINEQIKHRCGGLHSAKLVLVSVNFAEIEHYQASGAWDKAAHALTAAAQQVERAGADFLLICTNTMHKVAAQIEQGIDIPILHLADATALAIKQQSIRTVGLLGTKFTMEQDFYKSRLTAQHGLDVIVPSKQDREIIHNIIYQELCLGIVKEESREQYLSIIDKLHKQGAEAIIEGCTEIVLLVQQQHTDIPLFDTTAIHAVAAAEKALA